MEAQGLASVTRHFLLLLRMILALHLDVAGSFDKDDEVPFGLDVLSNAEILRPFLK